VLIGANENYSASKIRLCWEGTYKHWTGVLEWTTGLEYWTDIFLAFTHVVVVKLIFHRLRDH